MIHGNASEQRTLTILKKQAWKEGNRKAIEELSTIQIPFGSWEELYYQRKWSARFSGQRSSKKTYPKKLFKDWSDQWMPLFLEASSTDLTKSINSLDCPTYFFISTNDLVANNQLSKQYFKQLIIEKKKLVWFYESTHEIPSEEPERFSEALLTLAEVENWHNK